MNTKAVLSLLLSALRAEQRTTRALRTLHTKLDTLMTTTADVQAALAAQTAALATLQQTVDTKQEAIAAAIAALEAKIASAPGDAELQAILDGLNANTGAVADVTADVESTPTPAPAAE